MAKKQYLKEIYILKGLLPNGNSSDVSFMNSIVKNLYNIRAGFPTLSKLAEILEVLPVTTATVERSFSSMKLIKTRLRSRLGEETLEHATRICIEGPQQLSDGTLEHIIEEYKNIKKQKIAL